MGRIERGTTAANRHKKIKRKNFGRIMVCHLKH